MEKQKGNAGKTECSQQIHPWLTGRGRQSYNHKVILESSPKDNSCHKRISWFLKVLNPVQGFDLKVTPPAWKADTGREDPLYHSP
jgi:hypothetical protein